MPKVDKRANKIHKTASNIYKRANRKPKTAKIQRKGFNYYHNLPAELRMMVVDEMEPIDRCRFTQCSILSSMEAKRSMNYMYSLYFIFYNEKDVRITVIYDENRSCGFCLNFFETNDKKYMQRTNFEYEEFSITELPNSTDLVQFSAEYFKNNLLQDYQHIIKELTMRNFLEDKLHNFDFGFKRMSNLESLEMDMKCSILPILSKLRRPLKQLLVYGEENNRELENYDISNVSEFIDLRHFKPNCEQFLQLSAKFVHIPIGILTEEDICKIIKNWQNQSTEGNEICYKWELDGSNFSISKLLILLNAKRTTLNSDMIQEVLMYVKHGFEKGTTARLTRYHSIISLEAS